MIFCPSGWVPLYPRLRATCPEHALNMTDAIDKLLSAAAQARREKRSADARRDLLEAVALARSGNDRGVLARAVTELGRIERDTGHTDAALASYQGAAAIYRKQGDVLKLAHAIRHLGDIHQDAGRPAEAEPCFQEAIAIYRANPDTPALDMANALRPLALLKDGAGQLDGADCLWDGAKELYAAVKVFPGVAECAGRQAILARRREDFERARSLRAEATAAAENSGDYNSVRYVNEVRASISG